MTVPKHVGARRLLKLADLLQDVVPREAFSYSTWTRGEITKEKPCGTQACALGWACTIPSFRKAGLHLDYAGVPAMEGCTSDDPFRAAEAFFGLSYESEDATYLFGGGTPQEQHSPKRVAQKIRKFVAKWLKEGVTHG